MKNIQSYAQGKWVNAASEKKLLFHAITGEKIGFVDSSFLDFGMMLDYGRTKGGAALRKMTFKDRGLMIKSLALYLHKIKVLDKNKML